MKFKATLKPSSMPVILGLLCGLSRYSKIVKSPDTCIHRMKITKSKIYFSVRDAQLIEIYTEINTDDLLNDGFILESKKNNEIALNVDMNSLYETFKFFAYISSNVIMKLSKRENMGVLSFEFQDSQMQNVWITKDCSATPLSASDFEESSTPEIPSCEWNAELPPVKKMLNIFERIKRNEGEIIIVELKADLENASSICDISLYSSSELVEVRTRYSGCQLFLGHTNPYPSNSTVSKAFESKRLMAAFKTASDCIQGKKNESFVVASIPESDDHHWMCVMQSFHSMESCRLFYIIPSYNNLRI